MKIAHTVEGKEIRASAEAPKEAFCPTCGHPVALRKRRLMSNRGCVYFWRHYDGGNLTCRARARHIPNGRSNR